MSQMDLCQVCGDRASGRHYGVSSCDGCRGFFKRSVRRNLQLTCKEGGTCAVDAQTRNRCPACRFTKCIRVKMNRDAVQRERGSRIRRISAQLTEEAANITQTPQQTQFSILIRNEIYDSADKLVSLSIRSVLALPWFRRLSQSTKKKLLQESWSEVVLLTWAQWGYDWVDCDKLASVWPNDHPCRSCFITSTLHNSSSIVVSLSPEEAACLKAIAVLRGEIVPSVAEVQDSLVELFLGIAGARRAARLLSTLLPLARVPKESLRDLLTGPHRQEIINNVIQTNLSV